MREIGIGLLGFGTVGAGVVEGLQKNGELIAERIGLKLALKKIADLDLERDRGVRVDPSILTKDAYSVVNDPAVEVVVELIGGTDVAKNLILKALELKKPVVTANKALLAQYGHEILGVAAKNGTDVCFEAAVAGGIPIIRALTRGLVADHIESIHGILNGTCNYILSRMTKEHLPFDQALKEAQAAGYAEADPGLDIDGHDTAHKAVILASLAYGFRIPMDKIQVQGIRGLAGEDIEYARDLGYRIKLLAVIRRVDGEIEVHVNPALIPADHMLASVSGVFNAILVKSDVAGETLYYGEGAGRSPTASAVISDLADVAQNLASGSRHRVFPFSWRARGGKLRETGRAAVRCYMRLALLDKPGSMGRVSTVLGRHGISIASILQKEDRAGEHVPVIIVTHNAAEKEFQAALDEIDAMDIAGDKTVRMQIEDFK